MPTSITVAPGLTMSPVIISRPADGGHQDVRPAGHLGQVAGTRVGDRDRRALVQQQQRDRLADDVRAADHHGLGAGDRDLVAAQQLHHAGRRAGAQAGLVRHQPADAQRVEAVDVLAGVDPVEHLLEVEARPAAAACTRMPSTRSSAFQRSTASEHLLLAEWSRAATRGTRPSRPRLQRSPLLRTYTCEAGSSPTSTVTRPGVCPVSAMNRPRPRATRSRTLRRMALPSMMVAMAAARYQAPQSRELHPGG